jgi:release factor glutamine methyltransferase
MRIAQISRTCYNQNVYSPSDDTFALVDALKADVRRWSSAKPQAVIELGCGSGYVVCSMALMLEDLGIRSHILAVDASSAAMAATHATLEAHGVRPQVDLLLDDLTSSLDHRMHQGIDLLLFNPPYVVTPDDEISLTGIAATWAGGRDGRVVMDRLLAKVDSLLSKTGMLYMITIQQNRPHEILQSMEQEFGMHGEVVLTRRADEELISVIRLSRG